MNSQIIPRSFDRAANPEVLGVSNSENKEVVCCALVSFVGVSHMRLYVREGSNSLRQCPYLSDFKEHIQTIPKELDLSDAVVDMRREFGVDAVLDPEEKNEHTERRRALAWRWTEHTPTFFDRNDSAARNPKSLAAVCQYFWKRTKVLREQGPVARFLSKLFSQDDLTVSNAICNALVALGADVIEERRQKEIERRENVRKEHPDWRWVTTGGEEALMEPKRAAQLVAMGAGNYLDGEKPEPRIPNPMIRREDEDLGGATWAHAQRQREQQNENYTSWAMNGHNSHAFKDDGKTMKDFNAWISRPSSAQWKPKG